VTFLIERVIFNLRRFRKAVVGLVLRSAVSIKFVYLLLFCHSGLEPESRDIKLDSRFRGNDKM